METDYIILLCAMSVFIVLLIAYLIVSIKEQTHNLRLKNELQKAYSDENITKMEYDIATYYDDSADSRNAKEAVVKPVIDASAQKSDEKKAEKRSGAPTEAIFTQVEDDGVEEITGTYNSDTSR